MKPVIIGVDTGNRLMKTAHCDFNAGLVSHGRFRPAIQMDTLELDGNYYTISEKRVPYLQDKTEDRTYYLMTLIACAMELAYQNPELDGPIEKDIVLAVGLPPTHLPKLRDAYLLYFASGVEPLRFRYSNRNYALTIKDVKVYPQGFSAALLKAKEIKKYPKSYIIDIGGYTTDVIMLINGRPDMAFCESLDFGVIQMYKVVARKAASQFGVSLDDFQIESILGGNTAVQSAIIKLVMATAKDYAIEMMRSIEEMGVEMQVSLPIFIGGGSLRFRPFIESMVHEPMFIEDIHANALGYELLARSELNGK